MGLRCVQPQMENRRSDLTVRGREAAGTEITSAWTSEKRGKIQSTPSSGYLDMIAPDDTKHSSANTVHGQEQGPGQIEGLEWDMDKIEEEIDYCLGRLHDGIPEDDNEEEEDEFWAFYDEQQLTALNQRLALYRIRAREYEYWELDDSSLTAIYLLSNLERNGYYEHYHRRFEWYFDPEYCNYAHLQDYQRLMLRNNGEYEHWEYYRKNYSTLEGDQEFVQLWEKLLSKTKLIHLYLTDSSCELPRIERLVYYHAMKIAEGLPHILMTLVRSGYKMNFKEALRRIHNEGKYNSCTFAWEAEFKKDEPNLYLLEKHCKPILDGIGETAGEDDAYKLIMDAVKNFVMKPKTYYDYVKKKLGIAKEIDLIPPNPHKSST